MLRKLSGFVAFSLAVVAPACRAAADVVRWNSANISSPRFESHPAFDPGTGDFYFVRSSPQFQGWRIKVSHCTKDGWSEPEDPSFAGDGVEADPYFANDGRTLYFISSRSESGVKQQELDCWVVVRDDKSIWGIPTRLPEPINSSGNEWFPHPAPDGWLYFGSDRAGGRGATDIWRARPGAEGKWTVENLGEAINTPGEDYEPLISPDGKTMIVMADGGLYESLMTPTGWGPRQKLPPEVNVTGNEIGALFSPSGKSLMFARDTKGPESGELFIWYRHGKEDWPPECPAKKR